jgi:hypothetical protein
MLCCLSNEGNILNAVQPWPAAVVSAFVEIWLFVIEKDTLIDFVGGH